MFTVTQITDPATASRLHDILDLAFLPFKPLYTAEAYAATVVSAEKIQYRISSPGYTVYGVSDGDQLAGTVTTRVTDTGDLYFMTMAVAPCHAGKGLGKTLLGRVEDEASSKHCAAIYLETYAPLLQAIRLYESCGYRRTGRKRDYSGIEVFEMRKDIGALLPCSLTPISS